MRRSGGGIWIRSRSLRHHHVARRFLVVTSVLVLTLFGDVSSRSGRWGWASALLQARGSTRRNGAKPRPWLPPARTTPPKADPDLTWRQELQPSGGRWFPTKLRDSSSDVPEPSESSGSGISASGIRSETAAAGTTMGGAGVTTTPPPPPRPSRLRESPAMDSPLSQLRTRNWQYDDEDGDGDDDSNDVGREFATSEPAVGRRYDDDSNHDFQNENNYDDSHYEEASPPLPEMNDPSSASSSLTAPSTSLPRQPPVPYLRNEEWLEEATATLLDLDEYPVGSLTEEDLVSMGGVMAAWSRRSGSGTFFGVVGGEGGGGGGSASVPAGRNGGGAVSAGDASSATGLSSSKLHAAMSVERLLKRVVDDVRAGNPAVKVSTRLYTYAIEAWARSGARGAAQRAQLIHDNLVKLHEQTGDPLLAPTVLSYNVLLNAWSKSSDDNAPIHAERILSDMLRTLRDADADSSATNGEPTDRLELRPDAVTFSTIIDIHSKNSSSIRRCEELFAMMDQLNVRRNVYTFSALQSAYARCDLPEAYAKAKEVLDTMLDLYERGDVFARPNCVNFNQCLHALSRSWTVQAARRADEMLRRMELSVEEGGYDVEPDRMSYALTILAASRCPDATLAADLAEENLVKMEARAMLEERRRREVSSVAPPNVVLDVECFNVALAAISRSRRVDAFNRTISIVRRMEQYSKQGKEFLRPTIRSWNAVLNAIARSPNASEPSVADEADRVMDAIFASPLLRPNAFTFAAVLSAYQRSSLPDVEKSDALVRKMEDMYDRGELDSPPDVYHMTILCSTWAKSQRPDAPDRCLQILTHMAERYKAGYPDIKPNVRTYNAVLDGLCRTENEDRAEQLLYHMMRSFDDGDEAAKPDSFSFNSVIHAFCRSKKKDSGKRAEMMLERFLEFHEEHPDVGPDTRSLSHILVYYGRSRDADAPYRAEYIFHRMVDLYRNGMTQVEPNVFAVTTVINSYAYAKHPDAGRNGERLVKLMTKLSKEFPSLNVPVNTAVRNSLLFAWASCGDMDSGHHAERHLDEMERSCANGDSESCPDTRSYFLVLSAWSKSKAFDKAERAQAVLRRMEEQVARGNPRVVVDEHAYSLVINACAFSNASEEAESKAFQIAVTAFDHVLNSKSIRPESLTYGWFLQACGRLSVPHDRKVPQIRRAFAQCCEDGLVSDFVLNRLRGATSDALFEELVLSSTSGTHKRRKRSSASGLSLSDLPASWSRRVARRSP